MKFGKTLFEGGGGRRWGVVRILRDFSCMRSPIETVECIQVNIYGVGLTEFGHKTAEIHYFCIQLIK